MAGIGEIEGLRLSGININDLLLPSFIKKIEEAKLNLNAVSLLLVREEGVDNNKTILPFVFNHQNSQEVKDKVLHISGREKELEILSKIAKEVVKIK